MISNIRFFAVILGGLISFSGYASSYSEDDFHAYLRIKTAELLVNEDVEAITDCYSHAIYVKSHVAKIKASGSGFNLAENRFSNWHVVASKKYISFEEAELRRDRLAMRFPGRNEDGSKFRRYESLDLECQRLWTAAYKNMHEIVIQNLDHHRAESVGYSSRLDWFIQ